MTKSFEQASDAIEKLLKIYQGGLNVVNGAQEVWENEQEQAGRIQELEAAMRCLTGTLHTDAAKHTMKLTALQEEVESQKAAKDQMESLFKQDFRDREADLCKREDELKESCAAAEKQLLLEKQNMVKELQDKEQKMEKELLDKEQEKKKTMKDMVHKLRKEIADLQERNQKLNTDLSKSQLSCEKTDGAYLVLSNERKYLQAQVNKMRQDTKVVEKEDTYL